MDEEGGWRKVAGGGWVHEPSENYLHIISNQCCPLCHYLMPKRESLPKLTERNLSLFRFAKFRTQVLIIIIRDLLLYKKVCFEACWTVWAGQVICALLRPPVDIKSNNGQIV